MADSEVSWKSKLDHVAQSAISFFSDIISSKKTHEGPVVEVDGATITYTQLIVNKDGEQIVPLKHGANRDAARIGLISRTCGTTLFTTKKQTDVTYINALIYLIRDFRCCRWLWA